MAKFQLLSCDVALGGDILNVVARHAFDPVTFPEMLTLKFIHGETAVTNIFDVGSVERDESDEFSRLQITYGAAVVREKMFPGAGTRLPLGDFDRYKTRVTGTKINPGVPGIPDLPPVVEPVPEPGYVFVSEPVPEPVPVDAASVEAMARVPTPEPLPADPTLFAPPSRRPTPVSP